VRIIATDRAPVTGLTYTASGEQLIVRTGTPSSHLTALAVATGAVVWERTLSGPSALAPNGRRVAGRDARGDTTVWDTADWRAIAHFNHDWDPEYRFTFSPDGGQLAGIGYGGRIWRWTVPPGYPAEPLEVPNEALGVRYSPGGRWLVALARPTKLRFWEHSTGQVFTDIEFPKVPVQNLRFELSPDEDTVAVLLEKPLLLSITRAREPLTLTASRGYVFSAAFSHRGQQFATGTNDGVRVFDARTGGEQRWFDFDCGAVVALACSPDGLTCAAGGENGQVVVWDVE
jgi:WD40 repeat protein